MKNLKEHTKALNKCNIINNLKPAAKNNFSIDLFIHSVNVGLLSEYIAKELSLSYEQTRLSYILGTLHDIGKSEIPSSILYKKGKLSNEEWIIMKMHPIYSEEFIKTHSVELCNSLKYSNIIKYHHEHWDGSGYPEGLSKEKIPLLSRIITIADIYDAITTPRIYRKTIIMDPVDTMEKETGNIIDPHLFRHVKSLLYSCR